MISHLACPRAMAMVENSAAAAMPASVPSRLTWNIQGSIVDDAMIDVRMMMSRLLQRCVTSWLYVWRLIISIV